MHLRLGCTWKPRHHIFLAQFSPFAHVHVAHFLADHSRSLTTMAAIDNRVCVRHPLSETNREDVYLQTSEMFSPVFRCS